MKKVVIVGTTCLIIGMLISGLGVYAAVSLSSDKVSYKDTTVDGALDTLFDESVSGKTKIAEAITNKGIETLDTDSYDTMVSNINNISTENPYLKYNEENGYIQAIDEEGEWVNLYATAKLPLVSKYYLLKLGIVQNNLSVYYNTASWSTSGGAGFNNNLMYASAQNGNYAVMIYVDLTNYNYITFENLVTSAYGWIQINSSNTFGGASGYALKVTSSGKYDISNLTGYYYITLHCSASNKSSTITNSVRDIYLSVN